MSEKEKIIEIIKKMNCNKKDCFYNEKNCYEYCKIKVLIKKIEKDIK